MSASVLHLDLNLVVTFAKVVELGSFTAAAVALNAPKSSVSRAVTRLEDALGVRLLQRTTRKLGLTPAGDRYLTEVRGPLARLGEASSDVTELGHEPRGLVRLSLAPELGDGLISPLLVPFVHRYPNIQIDLIVTNRRVNLIQDGIDLAVRAGKLDDSTLVARKVAVSEVGLFAAPRYLQTRGRPRRMADLARHTCVLHRSSAAGLMPWRLSGPRGIEQASPVGPITADDLGVVLLMTVAGLGIALLPEMLVHSQLQHGQLVRVLPDHSMKGTALYLVSPPLRHVPTRVSLLRDHLISAIGERMAGTPCAVPSRRPS